MGTIGAISFAARRAQRGLSLVELMLIIAVVALLLGGALAPWSTLWIDSVYQREKDNISAVHRAIIGYAGHRQTTQRAVVVSDGGSNSRAFTVPGGRPYLPCPDVDGDGYEDRQGYDVTGNESSLSATATLSIHPTNGNDFLKHGNCAAIRGLLPWKTLGAPAADQWGNRYTYGVDALWSHSLVGFNQDMAIDSYDPRLTVVVDEGNIAYQPRNGFPVMLTRAGTDYPFPPASGNDVSRQPLVVCSPGNVDTAFVLDTCENRPALAGRILTQSAATVLYAPRKNFASPSTGDVQRDTPEGVPYVVVSHGKNGHGAVNHLANIPDPTVVPVPVGVRCNAPITAAAVDPSAQTIDPAADAGLAEEAMNFPFPGRPQLPDGLRYCPRVQFTGGDNLENREFVAWPRSGRLGSNFDDIVEWRTREQLVEAMTAAGVLPVDDLPVFRVY